MSLTETILMTKAPIIQNIGANLYATGAGLPPYLGVEVDLGANQEIKSGAKTNLLANPPVIAEDILNGDFGWMNRGLVAKATRTIKEVVEFDSADDSEPLSAAPDASDDDSDEDVDAELAQMRAGNAE